MTPTLTDPLIGRLVDGRYQVVRRIARGGMATVYLARDRRLDRDVALKVMHQHLAEGTSGAEFVARFRREARTAAKLAHHGLVGVLDQGVDGETSYLTMEYVEGTTLRRRLGEQTTLTVGESLRVAEAVLDALAAAHHQGLVHRDIKPENVLLGRAEQVKVADFGLARAVTEVTSTTTGTILGTVAYLAPELVSRGQTDTRTDVYAVGILLYEMLTGSQPFTGATPIQVAYQHVHAEMPAPSDQVGWLPVEVDELVGALAARDPDDRPHDAAAALDLVRRTRAVLDEATLDRRAEVVAAVPDPATTDPDATTRLAPVPAGDGLSRTVSLPIGAALAGAADDHPTPAGRRRRLGWLLIALAVLGSAALGVWYVMSGPGAYTTVPAGLVGAEQAQAEQILTAAGLDVGVVEQVFDPDVPAGSVVATDPGPGAQIRKDGAVDLDVSKGPDLREVPSGLAGTPVDDAVGALVAAGFVVPEPTGAHDDVVAADLVLSISAVDGAELPVGTEVVVTYSLGPAPVEVPDVVGLVAEAVKIDLEALGLKVSLAEAYSEEYEAGLVTAQSLAAGETAYRTDTIEITVSLGPPLVEVPDVMRNGVAAATERLEAAGFVVEVQRATPYFGLGFVVAQSVEGGGQAPKGSTITLTIT